MKPGDLVRARDSSILLWHDLEPDTDDDSGYIFPGSVGLVVQTTDHVRNYGPQPRRPILYVLVLFGQRLGWNDASRFEVITG